MKQIVVLSGKGGTGKTSVTASLAHLASRAAVRSQAALPEGLIVSRRGPHLILLNFAEEPLAATVQGQTVTVGSRDVQVVGAHGG